MKFVTGAALGASVVMGGALVASSVRAAGALQDTELQISRFSGSLTEAKRLMAEGVELGVKTPFETDTINELTAGLLQAGVAAKDVMGDVRRLAAVAEDDQALKELGQVFGKGFANQKFDTERTNQFFDRKINLFPALQQVTGLGSVDEVRKAIEQGKIGVAEMRAALDSLKAPGGQFFGMMEARSKTLPGLWSTVASNVKEVEKSLGRASVGPLSDGLTTIIDDVMPRMISDADLFGESMGKAMDFAVAAMQEMTAVDADWERFWSGFEIELGKVLERSEKFLVPKVEAWLKSPAKLDLPFMDEAAVRKKGAEDRAWWIDNVNLGWLKNVELPVARALDMEAVIDWPGRTGQPWKPGGAVEFVQGEIAKQEAKLSELMATLKPKSPDVGYAVTPTGLGSPATGQGGAKAVDGSASGRKFGADSEIMERILTRMDENRRRRAEELEAAKNAVAVPYAPTPSGFGSDADDRPEGEGTATSGQDPMGRYFVPGAMAQAINRITRRSTGELVYMQAEKQTAELQGIRRELEGIRKEMGNPVEVPVDAPGRFSKN